MPGKNVFIMTGIPRSGTTYLASVLYLPPQVVTVSEARGKWKQFYLEHGPSGPVVDVVQDFRRCIVDGEPVHTLDGTAGFQGEGRVDTWNQKKVTRSIAVDPNFVLGMKNPEVFLAYLNTFKQTGVKCVITVRHPVAIVNSWVSRVRRRIQIGKSIAGAFAHGDSVVFSSRLDDVVDRRIDLHNFLARQIVQHRDDANVLIVRYEEWFQNPALLDTVARFLNVPHLGYLRPAPILPQPPALPADEQDRILHGCTIAAEYGYPVDGGRLRPPALPAGEAA